MRTLVFLVLTNVLSAADVAYDRARVHHENYGTGKDAVVFIHGWT